MTDRINPNLQIGSTFCLNKEQNPSMNQIVLHLELYEILTVLAGWLNECYLCKNVCTNNF